MSTKTTKRKRANSTKAVEATVGAPAAVASERAAEAPSIAHSPTLGLASHCTVKDAGVLKTSLVQLLEEPDPVTIDAGSVERIDTATMQLLYAFVRDRAAHARRVNWRRTSKPIHEAARLLGVAALLDLPAESAA